MPLPSFGGSSPPASLPTSSSHPPSHPPSFPSLPRSTSVTAPLVPMSLPSLHIVSPLVAHPQGSLPAPSSLAPPLHDDHHQHDVHRPLIPLHFPAPDAPASATVPPLPPHAAQLNFLTHHPQHNVPDTHQYPDDHTFHHQESIPPPPPPPLPPPLPPTREEQHPRDTELPRENPTHAADNTAPTAPSTSLLPQTASTPTHSRQSAARNGEHSTPNPKKRPHRSISHSEKRRLCELSEQHPQARHNYIAKLYHSETGRRVERSTVTRVLQRKDFWLNAGSKDSNRKRLASPRFRAVEEALYELIRNRAILAALRVELSDRQLIKYSKAIASVMKEKYGCLDKNSPNYTPNLSAFRGSLSWIQSFKKRNALMSDDEEEGGKDKSCRTPGVPASPLEVFDMWQTELDKNRTKRDLAEFARLEDVYFLEATVIATTALPEHASEASASSSSVDDSRDDEAAVDEALGLVSSLSNDRSSVPVDLSSGAAFPTINFAPLVPLPSSLPGPSHSSLNNNSHEHHNGFNQTQSTDPFGCAPVSGVEPSPREASQRSRHVVDEDSMIVALLSANGVGDRPFPWLIGKRPLKTVGSREGEVWHDSSMRYFHNAKGWLTSRIVRKWIEEFDATLDRRVAVLTSLLTGCDLQLMELQHITVLPLPRTAVYDRYRCGQLWRSKSSPLYQGIEETFRTKYRCLVMEKAIQAVCRGAKVRPVPLKTAAGMIRESWEKVPIPLIRRAWRDLEYIPARLHRSCGQPRMSAKSVSDQRMAELSKLVQTYRNAIDAYSSGVNRDVCPSDLEVAINEPRKYVWLSAEASVFHPKGTVVDFVRSVCSAEGSRDADNDDYLASVVAAKYPLPPITSYEEALLVANKLAEFMKGDEKLSTQHSLYLIGNLQLEVKKLYDQRQDAEHTSAWPVAGGHSTD